MHKNKYVEKFGEKPRRNVPPGRLGSRLKDDVNMDLREVLVRM
jgi:hypothetical protein